MGIEPRAKLAAESVLQLRPWYGTMIKVKFRSLLLGVSVY
jgi:hypothetical protein